MGTGSRATLVNTFRDALGVAMALADDYAFANAAVLIEPDGQVHDIGVVDGVGTTIDEVIGWICHALERAAAAPVHGPGPVAGVLVISVRPFEADIVREADLFRFRAASWSVARAGASLLDWIETDGDLFRSYAYTTCPAAAWPHDPPLDRKQDGAV